MTETLIINSCKYVSNGLEQSLGYIPCFYIPVGGRELFYYYKDLEFSSKVIVFPENWQVNDFDKEFLLNNNFSIEHSSSFNNFLSESRPLYKSFSIVLEPAMIANNIGRSSILFSPNNFDSDIFSQSNNNQNYTVSYVEVNNDNHIEDINESLRSNCITNYINVDKPEVFTNNLVMNDITSFYKGRVQFLSARSFNSLFYDSGYLIKKSRGNKALLEAEWLLGAPKILQQHLPKTIFDEGESYYKIQYICGMSLAEIVILPDSSHIDFKKVFDLISSYLKDSLTLETDHPRMNPNLIAKSLFIDKLRDRKNQTLMSLGISEDEEIIVNGQKLPSFNKVEADLAEFVSSENFTTNFMHGDFCFSNIIYDNVLEKISLIDPRGSIDDLEPSIFGILEYDLVKLLHSIVGQYDLIVFEKYKLTKKNNEFTLEIKTNINFNELHDYLYSSIKNHDFISSLSRSIRLLPSLFLSMIPLHNESPDRQMALYIKGLLLHSLNKD